MEDPNHWNFNETILNSDSHLLAYSLSTWLIALAAIFNLSMVSRSAAGRGRKFTADEIFGFSLVLPAVLAMTGFVKISQIYLLLAMCLYLCLRVTWLRAWPMLLGVTLSLLVVLVQMRSEVGAVSAKFAPFRFDRIHPEWVPYFFIIYFIWAWLFLFLWARVRNVNTLEDLFRALRSGNSLPVELVFVVLIAGLIPYLLLDFYSPAWKYFTEFHAVLAAIFIAAFIPRIDLSILAARLRSGQISLAQCFGLILTIAVCGHLFMTTEGATYRMVKSIGEARAAITGKPLSAWRSELRRIDWSASTGDARIIAREKILQCLENLGHQPKQLRQTAVIYIPKTNRLYWDMRQVGAGATPFIAPAESGMAMVNGIPEFEDIGWAATGWGYPQYKLPSGPETPSNQIQQAVSKAREGGFRVLWVLNGLTPVGCDLEKIALD
jgi:hypothetical protein